MNTTEPQKIMPVTSDPTAIGQFGLAMITLVAASQKLGWTEGIGALTSIAICLGGIAQLYAGMMDAKHNKSFGATVFFAFGVFWLTVGGAWMIKAGVFGEVLAQQYDGRQLGFFFLGYFIFALFATVATLEATKQLFFAFIFIDLLMLGLTLNALGIEPEFAHEMAAWSELMVSIIGFYGVGGYLINNHLGYTLLPMGKPFGVLKK
jgi:succinate-acetate transporter protein